MRKAIIKNQGQIKMQLQLITEIPCAKDPFINYSGRIFMTGSCFVEHIGSALRDYRFHVTVNPCGILYNPLSLLRQFDELDSKKVYTKDDLFFHENLWHSPAHHTSFSRHGCDETLAAINDALDAGAQALADADTVAVTWGTAWVYTKNGEVLANCHRLPRAVMKKRILTFEECAAAMRSVASRYPQKNIIHTISPVRHLRDGFVESSRSKALLLAALHEAIAPFRNNRYFPSYEIMIDSLRDYRFYAEDMVHPSAAAVAYIRDFFFECFLTDETKHTASEIEPLLRDLRHRPFRPESDEAIKFYISLRQRLRDHDGVGSGFSAEIDALTEKIGNRKKE